MCGGDHTNGCVNTRGRAEFGGSGYEWCARRTHLWAVVGGEQAIEQSVQTGITEQNGSRCIGAVWWRMGQRVVGLDSAAR